VTSPDVRERLIPAQREERRDPQQIDCQHIRRRDRDEREGPRRRVQQRGDESAGRPAGTAQRGGERALRKRTPPRPRPAHELGEDVRRHRPPPAGLDEQDQEDRRDESRAIAVRRRVRAAFKMGDRRTQPSEECDRGERAGEQHDVLAPHLLERRPAAPDGQDRYSEERGGTDETVHAASDQGAAPKGTRKAGFLQPTEQLAFLASTGILGLPGRRFG
jgi:hypothetical protein